jgi:hypothetical protein
MAFKYFMANQRYYLTCPKCLERHYFGKSLGEGIYNRANNQDDFLRACYDWMWKHMVICHQDELTTGELFKVMSE